MKNMGRTALMLGLSAALVLAGPTGFFQGSGESAVVYAQEEEGTTDAGGSPEEGTTQEAASTTEKKEEKTTQETSTETTQAEESTQEKGGESSSHTEHTTGKTTESTERSTRETTEESSQSSSGKQTVTSRKDAEIRSNAVKNIEDEIADEDAPDGEDRTGTFIPKIYNDTRLAMKNNKEYIAGYVYFNQGDSAWNQNGYCIAKAGCGPTSMAVVITSLTGKWVTPLDTAIWGYQHGYYSRAGSAHEMIPAMAAAYGLNCQGVGTDYAAIKKALKEGKPVVALMGPGYFTRGGHFMVLVAIDDNDCVTVADVGSRARSAYKYHLSDVIAQSKSAGAGGPFWVMSYSQDKKALAKKEKRPIKNYTKAVIEEDFADISCFNVNGELPEDLKAQEETKVTVKKVVTVLKMSTGEDFTSLVTDSTGTPFSPVKKTRTVISDQGQGSSDEVTKDRNLALVLKRDIARRQWEKRISLTELESYLHGTIDKFSADFQSR